MKVLAILTDSLALAIAAQRLAHIKRILAVVVVRHHAAEHRISSHVRQPQYARF